MLFLEGKRLFLSDLAKDSGEIRDLQYALLITKAPNGDLNLSATGIHPSKLAEIQRILVS